MLYTVKDLMDVMDGVTDWIKRLTFPNDFRRPAHFVPLLGILKAKGSSSRGETVEAQRIKIDCK